MLDELKEILLGIPEIRDYTNGNVYTHYLDKDSIFPCITLVMIAASDIESVSIQIKIWTMDSNNPTNGLISIHEAIMQAFDSRIKKQEEARELFGKFRLDSTLNPLSLFAELNPDKSSLVEETTTPVDEIVLTEKFNDIEVFSLPIILASKDILPVQAEPEKVVETQPKLVGRTEIGINTTGEAI